MEHVFLPPLGFARVTPFFFFLLEGSFVWLVKSTGSEMRLPGLESWLPISQSFAFLGLDGEDDDRGDVSDGISFQGILWRLNEWELEPRVGSSEHSVNISDLLLLT